MNVSFLAQSLRQATFSLSERDQIQTVTHR
jgi:hypothetical protein